MSEQNNIPSFGPEGSGKARLAEDKLLAYLEGTLPPHEQREVELWLAEEGMESDAMEGLKMMPVAETRQSVNRINHNLNKKLKVKKHKRRPTNTNEVTYIAIGIILFLAVLVYFVITKTPAIAPPPAVPEVHSK
jgi:anti-sigma factor RsiW